MVEFFLLLLAAPAVFQVSAWIVNKTFDAVERFGRFRGTICL